MTELAHREVQDLLGPHALDALEEDEGALVERHLATCLSCRAELDGHREVAAALAMTSRPVADALPAGLWDRIAAGIADAGEPAEPVGPAVEHAGPSAAGGPEPREAGVARRPRTGQWWTRRGAGFGVIGAAVAAAAAIVVLAVSLAQVNGRVGNLQDALANHSVDSGVVAALAVPGHVETKMRTPSGSVVGVAVVADGRGYLFGTRMPELPRSETYQLWAMSTGQAVSLGLLGNDVSEAAFTMRNISPTTLAVTVEPAGGVSSPTADPVASAHL